MNDVALKELKVVVERAVRPVRATMARKRKMREELLAHLVSIFEEESENLGDDQAALGQAKRRFGDCMELTTQLQQAVPRWDRCRSILEDMGYRPDESAWHLAGRHFLVTLIICFYLPLWRLLHEDLRNLGPIEKQLVVALVLGGAVLVFALFNVVLSIALARLLNRIGPVLVSKRWRRILMAVLGGLAVLCSLVLPPFIGAAVLFFLMARQATEEWRYETDWA